MNTNAYLTMREAVVAHLSRHELSQAIDAIRGQLTYAGSWSLRSALDDLQCAYALLLSFFKQGAPDATRQQQHLHFLRQAYELSERIHRDYLFAESGLHRAEVWRRVEHNYSPERFVEVLQNQPNYQWLFDVAWAAPAWSIDEEEAAFVFLLQPTTSPLQQGALLGGITLALLSSFDVHRMQLLLRLIEMQVDGLPFDRAVLAIVCATLVHPVALPFYPEVEARLKALATIERFQQQMLALQLAFLSVHESNNGKQAKQEQTIDELIKRIMQRRERQSDGEGIDLTNSTDPEVQELQELLHKQMSAYARRLAMGIDMNYRPFSVFVRRLSFFADAVHWFIPFDKNHPDVLAVKDRFPSLLDAANGKLCDTDRYGLVAMCNAALQAITEQEQTQTQALFEQNARPPISVEMVDEKGQPIANSKEQLFGFVHDLYRYFRLFVHRNEGENPFRRDLQLYDHPLWAPLFGGESTKELLAKHAFALEQWPSALHLLQQCTPKPEWLKAMAHCATKLEDYPLAISYYEQLLRQQPDEPSVLAMLGLAHEKLKQYDEAIVIFYRLAELQPDNVEAAFRLGLCFFSLHLYQDAVDQFYKVVYLEPKRQPGRSMLALSLTAFGRFDEAARYFDELIADAPAFIDYQNAGHNEWLRGNIVEAATLYAEALKLEGKHFLTLDFFDGDRHFLTAHGLTDFDFRLMVDLVNQPQ